MNELIFYGIVFNYIIMANLGVEYSSNLHTIKSKKFDEIY